MSDLSFIVRCAVATVCVASLSIVFTFEGGLFNPIVDNKMIFDVLGPMTHEIMGALLMLTGGITTFYLTRPKDKEIAP